MSIVTLTLDEQHEILIALMKAVFGGGDSEPDVSEDSFNWLWLKTQAGATTDEHAHIFATINDLLPDTAAEDVVTRWGTIKGVIRKGATSAHATKGLRVNGNAAASVTLRATLTHTSGQVYEVSRSDIVGPGGSVDVDIEALGTGSATGLNAGEHLTFDAAPVGINPDAVLVLDLEDGDDLEDLGAYRARVLQRFSEPPMGGTASDYVQWAIAETGVAVAFCYPIRAGLGTVDLVALAAGSGSDRILSGPKNADVQAALDLLRPVTVKGFRLLVVTANEQDVEFTTVDDGALEHQYDWNDAAPPTVGAFDVVTRQLTFSAIPADLQAGDRITIKPLAGGGTGAERIVESLVGGNDVILENDPDGDVPAVGDTLYSGGPLVAPTRAAIQALFDSLGTANPDAKPYGAWEGNLRPSAIGRVSTAVVGVKDGTVVVPVATVIASDPAGTLDDSTIDLIVSRRILVRKAH